MRRPLLSTLIYLLMFSTTLLMSCNSDNDNCLHKDNAIILSVAAPDTVKLNSTSLIEIQFQVNNGCGDFNRLIEDKNGNQINIAVEAIYRGCVCTQNLPILNVNYDFKPKSTGSYALQFGSDILPDIIKQIEVVE